MRGEAAATSENSQPNFCVERKEKQRQRRERRDGVRPTEGDCAADEDRNPALRPPLPHPTSARLLLKEPAPSKTASGRGRPRLSSSRWRGGSRLAPCRAPGSAACGKAIRNLGSVVTFRIWGVFTSNWSILSLGESKVCVCVGGCQPGKGELSISRWREPKCSWGDHDARREPGPQFCSPAGETGQVAFCPFALGAPWLEKG